MAAENQPSPSGERPISPVWLLGIVRKSWVLVLAVMTLVLAAAVFITLGTTRIYEASATILFDPNVPRPLGEQVQAVVTSDGSSYLNNKEYYRTQQWMLQSMRTASEVVRQLRLDKDPTFLDPKDIGPQQDPVEAAAQILLMNLSADQVRDSRLMNVSYRDRDRERAQRILSTLVDTFVQQNLDDVFGSASTAADWLRTQVTTLRSELETAEMALHDYKKNKNILSLSMDDQSNMLREEMSQLNGSLTAARTKRENTAARVDALRKVLALDPEALPALELINSPVLQDLRERYVDAERSYDALTNGGKGVNHPEVLAARAARDRLKAALLAEVKNIQAAFEKELAATDKEIAGLRALYSKAESRALEVNLLEIEFNRLRRAKDTNERLFSLVVERSKESDLTRMLKVNNIRVVDRPLLPGKPVRPNVPLNLAAGLMVGAMLGVLAAVGRERMDRTLRSPDEIDRALGISLLGVLPEAVEGRRSSLYGRRSRKKKATPDDLANPELLVHRQPSSAIAEAARAIRTNIVFMAPDKPDQVLLVTSAGPAEGKTTVACAIAITMAQTGKRVLVLDCDLRRPRLHRVFSARSDDGLTNALVGAVDVEDLAKPTPVENLWVVPAGPLPPNPSEILQSESFKRLLGKLRASFDRIIIDSPPLLPVTDAAILSTMVDGTVVVVRHRKTTRELAKRATRSLRDLGVRIVGCVMNALDANSRGSEYYQYYYYRSEQAASAE